VRIESWYLLGFFSGTLIAVQELQPAWPDGDCRLCITEIDSSVDKLRCCRRVSLHTKVTQSCSGLFRPRGVQEVEAHEGGTVISHRMRGPTKDIYPV